MASRPITSTLVKAKRGADKVLVARQDKVQTEAGTKELAQTGRERHREMGAYARDCAASYAKGTPPVVSK